MEIKMYVDFDNREVLTEKEFNKKLSDKAKEMQNDEDIFNNYLIQERNFSPSELFHLGPCTRNEICQQFNEYCKDKAEEALQEYDYEHYNEFILEV